MLTPPPLEQPRGILLMHSIAESPAEFDLIRDSRTESHLAGRRHNVGKDIE